MKKLIATCAMTFAFVGTASAQDDEFGGDDSGSGMDDSTDDSSGGGGDASGGGGSGDTSGMDTGGGGGGEPTMGIVTELNTAGNRGIAHFLWGMGGNYLDIEFLFGFANIAPDGGDSTTVIDVGIGVNYRMYKDMDGRIHPYLAPGAFFSLSTDEADGEPKAFGVGVELGVDFKLFDQFTLGAALGGGLTYQITEAVNVLQLGVYTTSINATYWWGGA